MKYIQYAVARRETGNASGKAKRDAFNIAEAMGFKPSYNPSSRQAVRVLQQALSMPGFMGRKVIFFQYPAVSGQMMTLFRHAVSAKSYKIALVHDLLSIQGFGDRTGRKEADFLKIFDCLIVHNRFMESFVRRMGYAGSIIPLELFDYLHDSSKPVMEEPFSGSVSFAGNLTKAGFLSGLGQIGSLSFLLYGAGLKEEWTAAPNVSYEGLLPSDEIQYLMRGDYGLIWDGDSIETCGGPNGEYLRYNNPHKLSLCIASGKPVITWKEAAIAEFVNQKQIGVTVGSLRELESMDLSADYETMRRNVLAIKSEIAEGLYLKRALSKALALYEGEK